MCTLLRTSVLLLVIAVFTFVLSEYVFADDGDEKNNGTHVDIGITGTVETGIEADGPSSLTIEIEGPSAVNIAADEDVDLSIHASTDSSVLLNNRDRTGDREGNYDGKSVTIPSSRQASYDEVITESAQNNKISTLAIIASGLSIVLIAGIISGIRFKNNKRRQ